ncbi:MAG: nucleotide exchange factor GrpE [Bacillota bacterium]
MNNDRKTSDQDLEKDFVPEHMPEDEKENEKTGDELSLLREELEAERIRAQEYYDKYMRALADGENQRKRWQKDREELVRFGNMSLLRKLLPVVDDFKRAKAAMEQGGDISSLVKGVELIEKRLLDLLDQEGVKAIPAEGEMFDPQVHEAFSIDESGKYPDGTIVQEFQTGYMYLGRVLRPSMVVVAQTRSTAE